MLELPPIFKKFFLLLLVDKINFILLLLPIHTIITSKEWGYSDWSFPDFLVATSFFHFVNFPRTISHLMHHLWFVIFGVVCFSLGRSRCLWICSPSATISPAASSTACLPNPLSYRKPNNPVSMSWNLWLNPLFKQVFCCLFLV